METTTTTQDSSGRRVALGALAIVGFIVLIIIGIGLAIYTARYLPDLSSKLGGGAVSLSSIFHKKADTDLQVVTSTTTLPFDNSSAVSSTSTSTLPTETPAGPSTKTGTPKKPVSGGTTPVKYITVTTTTTVAPHGDPDLTVVISQVGYLKTKGDTTTFVTSRTIPSNKDGAVRFTVTNVGTNVSGQWKFEASLPTSSGTFTSPYQDSLGPNDNADFILGFSHTHSGDNRDITITVDPNNTIRESNENNNESSSFVNID